MLRLYRPGQYHGLLAFFLLSFACLLSGAAIGQYVEFDRSREDLQLTAEQARLLNRIQIDRHYGDNATSNRWNPVTVRLSSTPDDPPIKGVIQFSSFLSPRRRNAPQSFQIDVPIEISSQALKEIDVQLPVLRLGWGNAYNVSISLEQPEPISFPAFFLGFPQTIDPRLNIRYLIVSKESRSFLGFRDSLEQAQTLAAELAEQIETEPEMFGQSFGYGYGDVRRTQRNPLVDAPELLFLANIHPRSLRDSSLSYDPIDVIVIHQVRWDEFQPQQQDALLRWVAQGNTLVLSQTPGSRTFSSWIQGGVVPGPEPIPEATAIPASHWFTSASDNEEVKITQLAGNRQAPLLLDSRPIGFGKVVLLALDISDFGSGMKPSLNEDFLNSIRTHSYDKLFSHLIVPDGDIFPATLATDAIAGDIMEDSGLSPGALHSFFLFLFCYTILLGPVLWFSLRKWDRLKWFGPLAAGAGILVFFLTPLMGKYLRRESQIHSTVQIVQVSPDHKWAGIYLFDFFLPADIGDFTFSTDNTALATIELPMSGGQEINLIEDGNIRVASFRTSPWLARTFATFGIQPLSEQDTAWIQDAPKPPEKRNPINPWLNQNPDEAPACLSIANQSYGSLPFDAEYADMTHRQKVWQGIWMGLFGSLNRSPTYKNGRVVFGSSPPGIEPQTSILPAPAFQETFQVVILPE